MKNQNTRRGFTLIELLVVVLIIGILAAVAVPQYRFAVEKSRAQRMLPLLKAIETAQEAYYLATGATSPSFENLDISIDEISLNETKNEATFPNNEKIRLCSSCGTYGSVMGYPNPNIDYYIEFYYRKNDHRCHASTTSEQAKRLCKFLTGKEGEDGGYGYHKYKF